MPNLLINTLQGEAYSIAANLFAKKVFPVDLKILRLIQPPIPSVIPSRIKLLESSLKCNCVEQNSKYEIF